MAPFVKIDPSNNALVSHLNFVSGGITLVEHSCAEVINLILQHDEARLIKYRAVITMVLRARQIYGRPIAELSELCSESEGLASLMLALSPIPRLSLVSTSQHPSGTAKDNSRPQVSAAE